MEYRFLLSAGIFLVLFNILEASNGPEYSTLGARSLEIIPVQVANCSSTPVAIYQCVKIEYCEGEQRSESRRFCKWNGGPTHVCCPQNRPLLSYNRRYNGWSSKVETWRRPNWNGSKGFHIKFGRDRISNDDVETFTVKNSQSSFNNDEPECGVLEEEERSEESSKIISYAIGGSPVRTAALNPWMVAVGRSERDGKLNWFCGGALISRKIVITAAHCITDGANIARVGELDLISNTEPAQPQDSEIESSVSHGGYMSPLQYHDIAIVRLKTPVRYTKYVRPICLPPNDGNLYENELVTVTGWGSVEWGGEPSPILQEVQIRVTNQYECRARYGDPKVVRGNARTLPRGIMNSQMCAGDVYQGRDTCQGDSGGPIVLKKGRKRLVIGLVSSGLGCGSKIYPGIYTRVSYYSDWIRSFL